MSEVIKVENLSKAYQLGQFTTGTLSRDLERWWALTRGKEDPFLKVGEANDRSVKGQSNIVWSLKDINFSIQQGDAVGIVGKNGAGKSTLLKILAQVTGPTTGTVKVKGRIASLLEVGTGFHPELTGRENIFLNGAIMGMRKAEIKRKFDEIVDFSGVERYIDTPVKRYSSGMYVRLAFAVAAHLESEILIVDEVLAVGDAEFQKKCLGKMGEVSQGEGRTVLFVSHNMGSVKQLCNKGILLVNGNVKYTGSSQDVIQNYMITSGIEGLGSRFIKQNIEDKALQLSEAFILDENLNEKSSFEAEEDIIIKFVLKVNALVQKIQGYVVIKDIHDEVFIDSDTFDTSENGLEPISLGLNTFFLKINRRVLPSGKFVVYLNLKSIFSMDGVTLDSPKEILSFEVSDLSTPRGLNRKAKTNTVLKWNVQGFVAKPDYEGS